MSTTALFIRSYAGDIEWLGYCLRSLEKFASGFDEMHVVTPCQDYEAFRDFDFRGLRWTMVEDPEGVDGYLAQQITKLEADNIVESDLICFLDSDCFCGCPVSPDLFLGDKGRPILLTREWHEVGGATRWLDPTRKFLGFAPRHEYMAVIPLTHHRAVLAGLRQHCQEVHGCSPREYLTRLGGRHFSEFNALGGYAFEKMPELYDWRKTDPATDGFPRIVQQGWSWGGMSEERKAQYEAILAR